MLPESAASGKPNLQPRSDPGGDWKAWAKRHAPELLSAGFAPHHEWAWEWAANLEPGVSPTTAVLAWNRGAAKSGTFQGWCCWWAHTLARRFVLVVTETQEQAGKFVAAVAETLEANGIEPARNPQGFSRGWRKDMIRTADGFNLAAVGWDVATRGIRMGELRPDVILFDDVDGRLDTPAMTEKKQTILTQTFLPAGAPGLAVAFGQNVILAGGLMDQLVKNTADFLTDRKVSYVQAVEGLRVEFREEADGRRVPYIAEGTPTWPERLTIAALNGFLSAMGVRAFLREFQHDVSETGGGLWDGTPIPHWQKETLPDFFAIVVGIDPSGSNRGDEVGIVAVGAFRLPDKQVGLIVLDDVSGKLSPDEWAREAVALYRKWDATSLVAEANFGGDMVASVIKQVQGAPKCELVHASRGKLVRAEPVQLIYEQGRAWHRARFVQLETEMTGWHPSSGLPSPGRLDGLVWASMKAQARTQYGAV